MLSSAAGSCVCLALPRSPTFARHTSKPSDSRMGIRQSAVDRQKTKRSLFLQELHAKVDATVRRRSVVRDSIIVPLPVTPIFTAFRSLSIEWNLCHAIDPARRVDVVADVKLQRKKLKYLFVDKCTKLRVTTETLQCARTELEVLVFIATFCEALLGRVHPNLVHLAGYYSFHDKLHVIVEFCELGNLMNAYIADPVQGLRLRVLPTESEVCDSLFQICSGLAFLHSNGIVHGDLALENVFVTSENVLKLGDFDRAIFVGVENAPQPLSAVSISRRAYAAPEMFTYKDVPNESAKVRLDMQKADVWAVGVIFVLLLAKKPLFDAASPDDNGFQLFRRIGLRSYLKAMYLEQSAVCPLSDELLELADGLLRINPAERMTVHDALKTPWLRRSISMAEPTPRRTAVTGRRPTTPAVMATVDKRDAIAEE